MGLREDSDTRPRCCPTQRCVPAQLLSTARVPALTVRQKPLVGFQAPLPWALPSRTGTLRTCVHIVFKEIRKSAAGIGMGVVRSSRTHSTQRRRIRRCRRHLKLCKTGWWQRQHPEREKQPEFRTDGEFSQMKVDQRRF